MNIYESTQILYSTQALFYYILYLITKNNSFRTIFPFLPFLLHPISLRLFCFLDKELLFHMPHTLPITRATHLPRLYIPLDAFSPTCLAEHSPKQGETCPLNAQQAYYLGTVLRRQCGDSLRVFNASLGEWLARIIELRKEKGVIVLEQHLRTPNPTPDLKLAFALLKRDATDLIFRMGTELGVTEFIPIITERTNTHNLNLKRLTSITIEAAEQCERLDIPTIASPLSLATFLHTWSCQRALFAAIERLETLSNSDALYKAKKGDGLLIGPEGGFTPNERLSLQKHSFIVPLSLGISVLRADTAVAAGLALITHYLRSKESMTE